jgi:hypothetical protein
MVLHNFSLALSAMGIEIPGFSAKPVQRQTSLELNYQMPQPSQYTTAHALDGRVDLDSAANRQQARDRNVQFDSQNRCASLKQISPATLEQSSFRNLWFLFHRDFDNKLPRNLAVR